MVFTEDYVCFATRMVHMRTTGKEAVSTIMAQHNSDFTPRNKG